MGLITPWLLLMFTFLLGCGAAFNGPAWQASVGDMVPRAHLAGAVAINSMGFNIARSVGPAIGGVIVAAAGAAAAFAVNAASYIALIVVPLTLASGPPSSTACREKRWESRLRRAFVTFPCRRRSRRVLLRGAVFGMGASSVMALLPLVARIYSLAAR